MATFTKELAAHILLYTQQKISVMDCIEEFCQQLEDDDPSDNAKELFRRVRDHLPNDDPRSIHGYCLLAFNGNERVVSDDPKYPMLYHLDPIFLSFTHDGSLISDAVVSETLRENCFFERKIKSSYLKSCFVCIGRSPRSKQRQLILTWDSEDPDGESDDEPDDELKSIEAPKNTGRSCNIV